MLNIIYCSDNYFKILIKKQNNELSLLNKSDVLILENSLDKRYIDKDITILTFKLNISNEVLEENYFFITSLREVISLFDHETMKNILYYNQFLLYLDKNKFCGTCGNKTSKQTKNKFMHCDFCQKELYPQIAPCIIVRIHKENQILMARGVNFLPNTWGLIAGFVELGETLEEAVIREVKEEVGINVKNIKYFSSQAWPFPSSTLMVGFTADYESGDLVLEPDEIECADFYTKDTIPGKPRVSISLSTIMIDEWLNHK